MAQIKEWFQRFKRHFLAPHEPSTTVKPIIVLPAKRGPTQARRYLAAVAIAWNEGRILREWLDFHRLAGIDHVYFYDDGSTDDSAEIVRPYVDEGFVTYIPWTGFFKDIGAQQLAYAHALVTYGSNWRWMAFFDLDEFLFPVMEESLGSALSRYEDLPAIAVPWHMFGFCGHECRPPGLVTENYTQRVPFPPPAQLQELLKWKTIVDPSAVEKVNSPHFFFLRNQGKGAYTEDRLWLDKKRPEGWGNLRSEVFQLNHYFTQSKEDFAARRSAARWPSNTATASKQIRERAILMAESIESAEAVHDDLILRYVPDLSRILSERASRLG